MLNNKIMRFSLISVSSLSILWIWYLLRFVDQGRFVYTIFVPIFFGFGIRYLIDAVNNLLKKEIALSLISFSLTILFSYYCYSILLKVNDSLVTGIATTIATESPIGIFGIAGFWGIGLVIPMWAGFISICTLILYLGD